MLEKKQISAIRKFIEKEAKQYRRQVLSNINRGINLDKLRKMAKTHETKCIEFIHMFDMSYAEECQYKKMACESIENVDKDLFGCYNSNGICIGYDFFRYRKASKIFD